jgi:hypothetical protein
VVRARLDRIGVAGGDAVTGGRVIVLCDLARLRAASREADAAAEALEDAYLLTRAHDIQARLPRILAARSTLPPGRATRGLDDLLHGV